ncbi:autotransporter domain-containing protein [Sebaldella sp. S0638]|nr:autotransporter domain-containing protein [Sebaldella sp. S0638]MCP1224738.1 autotransporter domain-containing protein [Sebaldella sp. S0638]
MGNLPVSGNNDIILDDKVIQSIAFGSASTNSTMFFNNSANNNVILDSSLVNVADYTKGKTKEIIVNAGKNLKNYMPITEISSEYVGVIAINNYGANADTTLENYADVIINHAPPLGYDIPLLAGLVNAGGSLKNFANITINGSYTYGITANSGTITLNDGDISLTGDQVIGLLAFYNYAGPKIQPVINLESGNISLNGAYSNLFYLREGIIGLGSAGNTINASISGENSYLFSKSYSAEQYFSGKFHINGDVKSTVDGKASAFYYTDKSYRPATYLPPNNFLSDLSNLFVTNNGTLTIDVKEGSYLLGLNSVGLKVSDLENIQISDIILTGSKKVRLSDSTIYIDSDSNLDYQNSTGKKEYRDIDYYAANIVLNSGITVSGTEEKQAAMKLGGDKNAQAGENNGIIDLSGDKSIGIYVRNSKITNNGLINLENSQNGTGIYGDLYKHQGETFTNVPGDTQVFNLGDIKTGENGIGIYANTKKHKDSPPSYNRTLEVTNSGNITGSGEHATGIYLDNSTNSAAKLSLTSTSNIDLKNSKNGIGIYTDTINVDGTDSGTITVGENGIGIYSKNGVTTLNNLTLNLYGDNATGIYTDGTNIFTGNGTININGKGIVVYNLFGSGSFNQNFNIISAPGSSYTLANIKDNAFYSNSSTNLSEGGVFINGENSAVLLGSNSNLNSTDSNITGLALNGAYTGGLSVMIDGQILDQEATNQGIMSFGNNSTGIYAVNGASAKNEGSIKLGDSSVGIYGKGIGTGVSNTNKISVGEKSAGVFLENGKSAMNSGDITSSGKETIGLYSVNANNSSVLNSGNIALTGDKNIGIYTTGTGKQIINNTGTVQVGDSSNKNDPSIAIYSNNSLDEVHNTGNIISGKNSIGIYNNGGQVNQNSGKISIDDSGAGIYANSSNVNLSGGTLEFLGTNAVGIIGTNNAVIDNDTQLNIGSGNYGVVLNSEASLINRKSSVIGELSSLVYSDNAKSITNELNADLTITGSDSIGFYMINGGDLINKASITGNTGSANIGIYNQSGNIVNNGDIKIGNSVIVDPLNPFANNYAVGIYGENVQSMKNTGNIEIGTDAVGFYAKNAQTETLNTGNITSNSNNAIGIYLEGSAVRNTGNITLSGDHSMGIAAERNSTVKNEGIITINGNDSIGIYANLNSKVVNESSGKIYINGNDSIGVQLSGGSTLENYGVIQVASGAINSAQTVSGASDYTPPSIINAGVVKVSEKFDLSGVNLIIKVDPSSLRASTIEEIKLEGYALEDINAGFFLTNTVNVVAPSFNFGSNPIGIDPNFTQGTNARVYKFEDVFDPTTPGGGPNTGEISVKSGSLTFDAIPVANKSGKIDIWMEKINYDNFTQGAWYDQFAKNIEGNYLNATGNALKLYDKIDLITDVDTLRNTFDKLAGNMYANMNQREATVIDVFDTSLNLLQDSKNNTKENVKVNVIAGKGKLTENTGGVLGYNYESVGVLALREVERTYKHTFGYSAGYLHTNYEMNDGNSSEEDADTLQLGLHNKYNSNDWVLRNDVLGRVSFHNTDRNIDWTNAGRSELNGTYETYSISSNNKLGKELSLGKNASITPYSGLDVTYMTRPTFSEDGLEALEVQGNDAWSVKPKAGVELKGEMALGEKNQWKLKGALDVAYGYELGDLNEREYAKLVNVETDYHKLSKPEKEKGVLSTKAAIGVEVEDRYGIFLTGEYKTGNNNENEYRAGVTLKAVF